MLPGTWKVDILPPRRKKRKAPRKFRGLNIMKAAEAYALTNIWTEAAFNTNPIEFLTGFTSYSGGTRYNPGADGGETITLPELLGAGAGGIGGNYGSYASGFTEAVTKNVGGLEGLAMAGFKSAGVSLGFRFASRITRRPRAMLNAQLRNFGIGDMVRV